MIPLRASDWLEVWIFTVLVMAVDFFGDLLIKPKIVPRSLSLLVGFAGSILSALALDLSSGNSSISLSSFIIIAIICLGSCRPPLFPSPALLQTDKGSN